MRSYAVEPVGAMLRNRWGVAEDLDYERIHHTVGP